MVESICRVCGFDQDDERWTGPDGAQYVICSCCGAESGVDDLDLPGVRDYRSKWVAAGCAWFSSEDRPANWDLDRQMSGLRPPGGDSGKVPDAGVPERRTWGGPPGHTPSVRPRWARRPEILVMPDYGCFTWTSSPELHRFRINASEGLDLVQLGVSSELATKLQDLHHEWEEWKYTGVAESAEAAETWDQRAWAATKELQAELPDIDVYFQGDGDSEGRPATDLLPIGPSSEDPSA